jgi:hypothetical protein
MLVNGREALLPLVRLDSYGPLIGLWRDMLAASPQEAVPTKREAALAELAKLDGETMDLAASPQGEGSSADAPVEAVACPHDAWSVDSAGQQTHCVDCGCAHPAPIKPSADTGELRERALAQLDRAWLAGNAARWSCWERDEAADAILDLIQSERAG